MGLGLSGFVCRNKEKYHTKGMDGVDPREASESEEAVGVKGLEKRAPGEIAWGHSRESPSAGDSLSRRHSARAQILAILVFYYRWTFSVNINTLQTNIIE